MRLDIPGFVDLQMNGYRNVDFSDATLTEESFAEACRALFANGTAAMLPTVVTGPEEMYRHNLPLIARAMQSDEFQGRLPGIHVEGPFVSDEPGAVGAHPPEYVRKPDLRFFDRLLEWAEGRIAILTIAADVEGAEELCRHATAQGVTVSLGHQLAEDEDMARLAAAGARGLTHLGNGLPNLLPRHPNTIWAGLANDDLMLTVIADGHHLPPSTLKAMIRAKGVERTIVVSDASPLAGMPPGRYRTLGNLAVLEPNGKLHNPEKECLVGSASTMFECMNFLAGQGYCTLDEMLALGFHNPLRFLGVDASRIPAGPRLIYDEDARTFALGE